MTKFHFRDGLSLLCRVMAVCLPLIPALPAEAKSAVIKEVDFSKREIPCYLLKNASELEQSYEYNTNPFSGQPALLLKWNSNKAKWMQISFKKNERPVLPDIKKVKVKVEVDGFCVRPTQARCFNLRLIDAKNEVFQFRKWISWSKAGDWSLEFMVDPNSTEGYSCWGGDKNKKMDQPVSLLGFSVDFRKNMGPGEVYIKAVRLCSVADDRQSPKAAITGDLSASLLDDAAIAAIRFRYVRGRVEDGRIVLSRGKAAKAKMGVRFNYSNALGSWCTAPKLPLFNAAELTVKCTIEKATVPIDKVDFTFVDIKGKFHNWSEKVHWPKDSGTESVTFKIPRHDSEGKILAQPLRLSEMTFWPQGAFAGELRIDSLKLHLVQNVTDAFKLEVKTGNNLHVLKAGEKEKLHLELTNLLDREQKINAAFSVSDFNGKETTWLPAKTYAFKPGETITVPPPAIDKYGIYYIKCRLSLPENPADSGELSRSIAYLKPVGATPEIKNPKGFVMGIVSHPDRSPSEIEREADAVSLVGAKVLRTPCTPWDPKYEIFDKIVETFSRYGVNFDFVMSYKRKDDKAVPPVADLEKSREYYRDLFTRYKGRVWGWEVLNEPDWHPAAPSTDDYVKLAHIAREELDKADPDAKLLSSGFCAFDLPKKGKYQRDVMIKCNDIFDFHCFHGHAAFPSYSKVTVDKLLLPLRKDNNITIPWYSNETALSSGNHSEKEQAEAIFKKLLFAWSRGTIGYNWYNLRNKSDNPHNVDQNYGMFSMDFYPKAIYPAFNTVASLFRDKEYVRQLPLPDDIYVYEFKSGDEIVLGAWSENCSQYRILLETDASEAELIDLMGNAAPAEKMGSLIILPCTAEVTALRLKGATKVKMVPAAVELQLPELLMPEKSYPVECKFHNPEPRAQDYSFTLSTPDFVTVKPDCGTVNVAPGGKAVRKAVLKVTDKYKVASGEPIPLTLEYRAGNGKPDRVVRSVTIARQFAPSLDGEPLFELNKASQITMLNCSSSDEYWRWHSPDDLSAEVWLGMTDKALLLKVRVKDDIHYQVFDEKHFKEGDSIQVSLKTKDMAFQCEPNFYHSKEGQDKVFIAYTPPGLDIDRGAAEKQIKFSFKRTGDISSYNIEIPLSVFKINPDSLLKDGFRFNILVNDNDGHGRKGWIRLTPGIGLAYDYIKHPILIPKKNW